MNTLLSDSLASPSSWIPHILPAVCHEDHISVHNKEQITELINNASSDQDVSSALKLLEVLILRVDIVDTDISVWIERIVEIIKGRGTVATHKIALHCLEALFIQCARNAVYKRTLASAVRKYDVPSMLISHCKHSEAIMALSALLSATSLQSYASLSLESKILSWCSSTDDDVATAAAHAFASMTVQEKGAATRLCDALLAQLSDLETRARQAIDTTWDSISGIISSARIIQGYLRCLILVFSSRTMVEVSIKKVVDATLSAISCRRRWTSDNVYYMALFGVEEHGLRLLALIFSVVPSLLFPHITSISHALLYISSSITHSSVWRACEAFFNGLGTAACEVDHELINKCINSGDMSLIRSVAQACGPIVPIATWLSAVVTLDAETLSSIAMCCNRECRGVLLPMAVAKRGDGVECAVHPRFADIEPIPKRMRMSERVEMGEREESEREEMRVESEREEMREKSDARVESDAMEESVLEVMLMEEKRWEIEERRAEEKEEKRRAEEKEEKRGEEEKEEKRTQSREDETREEVTRDGKPETMPVNNVIGYESDDSIPPINFAPPDQ